MDSEPSQNPSSSSGSTATPQVRSRITVVCAECKRLKLKCDRKNPCGSCVKRDTTARCIYSPAAAEKVDLHSLNNRLIQVESLLAQFTSGQFPPQPPLMGRSSSSSTSIPSSTAQPPSVTPLPYTSLALSLDDVAAIWLDHLDVTTRLTLKGTQASTKNGIKLESNDYPVLDYCKPLPATSIYYEMTPRHNTLPFPSSPSPDVDPSVRPSITRALLDLLPPTVSDSPILTLQSLLSLAEQSTIHTYPSTNWKHFRSRVSHMVAILKPPPFNSSDTFKERDRDKGKNRGRKDTNQAREVHYNSRTGNPLPPFTPASAPPNSSKETEALAKSEGLPFFGAVCAALALGALESSREVPQPSVDAMQVDSYPRPSASLRGASSGTYLDAEYWYRMSVHVLNEYERGLAANVNSKTKGVESFGQDYLLACLFQVAFMVKGGLGPAVVETAGTYHAKAADGISGGRRRREKERDKLDDRASNLGGVAAIVFPLVGKMVNIARDLGLAKDPPEVLASALDSFKKARNRTEAGDSPPAISNLFHAEMRRRIWWDIFYYDVFVSDALGHEPLIGDDFQTKMPVGDVDEKVFSSVSTRIPPLQAPDVGTRYHRDGFHYFQAKCRLALVVRKIQRRMCTSEMTTTLFSYGSGTSADSKNGYGYSIDQAASMETEVTQWLDDLPEMYRLEKSTIDLSTVDPILAIQRCELAITAQRLILKIYMPFLRKHATVSETVRPPHQATCGSVNAAHLIIRASNLLFSVWTRRGVERPLPPSMISPAMFDFYPFTRVLLDSGVVCAHAAVKQFVPMMAPAAEDALDTVLKILQDPSYPSRLGGVDGFGSGHDVSVADAVKLLKELKQHAVDARGSMGPTLKRKHDDVEDDESADVDELESEEVEYTYVDADKPQSPIFSDLLQPPPESSSPISVTRSPTQTMQPDMCMGVQSYETLAKGKDDKSKKSKRAQPHPVVGIRHRGGDGSPLAKRRLSPAMISDTETQPQPTSNSPFTKQPIYPPSIHSQQPMSQPLSLIPSPLHLSTLDAEKYRSRSSSLTQPVDSGPFTRRESASSVGSYSSFQSTSSPRPIETVSRRYTTSSTQPPPMPQPSVPSPQSQPSLQSAYAVASHPTNLYDRASSYESQRGYAEPQGDAYAPAQSPYVASGSPYTTTSGPLSNASSPYTQTSTNIHTPAYPSPRGQNIPLSNGSSATYYAGYESGTPVSAGSYHNPFTGNGGGYDPEPMGDVKPSMQVDSYREPQPVYQPQTQWEPHQQQQQQSQHQYWQAQAPVNYYPTQ